MLQSLKKVFTGKVDNEAAIMKTAGAIAGRWGNPEPPSLEEAVYTVVCNITLIAKGAVFAQDAAASGKTPKEADYLLPSVLLGMLLTQKMWIIFDEKFDGGRVASYVAARHSLQNPKKDGMALFTEGAAKYNLLRDAQEKKGEEFENDLVSLIVSSFTLTENDAIAEAFTPLYLTIRDLENEMQLT